VSDAGRRKLLAIDDPLESIAIVPAPASTARSAPPRPAATRELSALFVRLPAAETDALARAAFELRAHKRELVAALIARYVDPHSEEGLQALRALLDRHRPAGR